MSASTNQVQPAAPQLYPPTQPAQQPAASGYYQQQYPPQAYPAPQAQAQQQYPQAEYAQAGYHPNQQQQQYAQAAYAQPGYPPPQQQYASPAPGYAPGHSQAAQPYAPQGYAMAGSQPPQQYAQPGNAAGMQQPYGYPPQGGPPGQVVSSGQPGPSAATTPAHLMGQAARASSQVLDPTGKYKLVMQGAFVAVEAVVTKQEGFKAEGGAMVCMSNNVDLVAKLDGGCGAALCRSCCAGESAFFSYFHLKDGTRGDVLLAPATPGDIVMLNLRGDMEWRIQKGSYLASDEGVKVGTAVQSLAQGCCSGEGFFILKASGMGRLLLNSYGSIVRYDLQPGEERRIDNGYLVAWHANMSYTIGLASKSIVASILSGEAIVTKFVGPGTVYVQTRSLAALAVNVAPYVPVKQENNSS